MIFSQIMVKNNVVISIWCKLMVPSHIVGQCVLMVCIDENRLSRPFGWQIWICLALADAWWSPHPHPVPTSHLRMSDSGWGPVSPVTFKMTSCLHFPSWTIFAWGECLFGIDVVNTMWRRSVILYLATEIREQLLTSSAGVIDSNTCPLKLASNMNVNNTFSLCKNIVV